MVPEYCTSAVVASNSINVAAAALAGGISHKTAQKQKLQLQRCMQARYLRFALCTTTAVVLTNFCEFLFRFDLIFAVCLCQADCNIHFVSACVFVVLLRRVQ